MSPPKKLWNERYEAIEIVGRGGEGEVWRGRDTLHDRPVALKVRKAPSKAEREALLTEARVLLSITPHPLLPVARDDFFEGRRYVLVMDWIEGSDLGRILAQQGDPGLPVSVVIGWLGQMATALDHLHQHREPVVHGDVKPSNAILTADGRVVLVDFGVSSRPSARGRGGTPAFRAPELAGGDLPTPAADVFGLAATAAALLTGRAPVGAPDWEGIPQAVAGPLQRAIGKALSVDPRQRPGAASHLVERMQSWAATDLPSGSVTYVVAELAAGLPSDDERAAASLLARHDSLVAEVAERHHGRLPVASPAFDAAVAVFRSPTDALKCALEIQQRSAAPPTEAGRRVAVHSGQAVLRSGTYAGDALGLAADLAHRGGPAQVLVSAATAGLVRAALPDGATLQEIGRGVFTLQHPDLPGAGTPPAASALLAPRGNARRVAVAAVAAGLLIATAVVFAVTRRDDGRREPPPIAITASSRPIMFESTRDGHRQLFALNPPGTAVTPLSDDAASLAAENAQPTLSPDGTKVLFVSERSRAIDLYVMNADGSGTRRLTSNPGLDTHPDWSPDGKQIVFVSDRGVGNQIYVMDAERGDAAPIRLLTVLPGQSGSPRYSPDGRSVVFANGPGGEGGDLYLADPSTANQKPRQLTTDGSDNAEPDWSPDGTSLVFSSRRTGSREVFTMPSAGGVAMQITDLRAEAAGPRWSPDGTLLVFQSAHQDEAFDLYALPVTARNAKASSALRLTNTPGAQDLNPTW